MSGTNTLVIYELSRPLIEEVGELLKSEELAGLVHLAQLRFLRRILVMFDSPESAKTALPLIKSKIESKLGCESVNIGFSMNNNESPELSHLPLPDRGKLLFISPPVSPPNEWNGDITEEEPNQRVHFEPEFNEKLHKALEYAQEGESCQMISPVEIEFKELKECSDPQKSITIFEAQVSTPALKVTSHE